MIQMQSVVHSTMGIKWLPCLIVLFFLKISLCAPFSKVFIEFITILLRFFYGLVFWPRSIWDLSSSTRDQTCTPCIGRWSINHWPIKEAPPLVLLSYVSESLSVPLCSLSLIALIAHSSFMLYNDNEIKIPLKSEFHYLVSFSILGDIRTLLNFSPQRGPFQNLPKGCPTQHTHSTIILDPWTYNCVLGAPRRRLGDEAFPRYIRALNAYSQIVSKD